MLIVIANIELINKCIDLMRRAKNLNMRYWQDDEYCPTSDIATAKSVRELHSCGNTACFVGYLAISKFFRDDGGNVQKGGSPEWGIYYGSEAVAKYLEISIDLADRITLNKRDFWVDTFDIPFAEVKPEHVIKVLKMIKKGELQ